jgi:hypothetical protein
MAAAATSLRPPMPTPTSSSSSSSARWTPASLQERLVSLVCADFDRLFPAVPLRSNGAANQDEDWWWGLLANCGIPSGDFTLSTLEASVNVDGDGDSSSSSSRRQDTHLTRLYITNV